MMMMKLSVAVILVIVSLVAAEPPNRPRTFYVKQSPSATPYQPSGWRPSGPSFNLPQQQPATSYGPPPPSSTTETMATSTEDSTATTTEADVETTTTSQVGNLEKESEKLQQQPQQQPNVGPLYVVVPQQQNYLYSAPLVVQQQDFAQNEKPLVPIQAVPAFAKIVEQPSRVQYATTTSIFTPYGASIVQIYQ